MSDKKRTLLWMEIGDFERIVDVEKGVHDGGTALEDEPAENVDITHKPARSKSWHFLYNKVAFAVVPRLISCLVVYGIAATTLPT